MALQVKGADPFLLKNKKKPTDKSSSGDGVFFLMREFHWDFDTIKRLPLATYIELMKGLKEEADRLNKKYPKKK